MKWAILEFCFRAWLLDHTASLRIYSPSSMSICTMRSEFAVLLQYTHLCR